MRGLAGSPEGAPNLHLALLSGTNRVDATQSALRGSGMLVVAQGADVARVTLVLGP
jgi:hypothetical protein